MKNDNYSVVIKKRIFFVASFFLLLGGVVYLFLYPNKFKYIEILHWLIGDYKINIENIYLLKFIYAFTSYCHAVFMPLYSVLLTQSYKLNEIYYWAIAWGLIDTLFEIMQLKKISEGDFYSYLPDGFAFYFEHGRFDFIDIIFIWLGVLSVFYLWSVIEGRKVWKN